MLIAHISDLHLGRDAATDRAAERLAEALRADPEAAVIVSGDVTHRGRLGELARFEALFRPLIDAGRVVAVPGNHDRLGDDAASALMPRERVDVWSRGGLHVVRIDSTGPQNRWLLGSHGRLTREDLEAIDAALDGAPAGATVAAVLHHHVLPLPEDQLAERLATLVGLPCASELAAGARLLELLRGRCDLVLHGHRHRPYDVLLDAGGPRPLRVLNAGSSTALGRVRAMRVRPGGGWAERWIGLEQPTPVGLPWLPAPGRAAA